MRQSAIATASHTPAMGSPANADRRRRAEPRAREDDRVAERAAGALHRPLDQRRRRGPHALRKERDQDLLRRVVDRVVLQVGAGHRADADGRSRRMLMPKKPRR